MGTLEVIPIDTSDDESMVTYTIDDTTSQNDMPQDGYHSDKESQLEEMSHDVHQTVAKRHKKP